MKFFLVSQVRPLAQAPLLQARGAVPPLGPDRRRVHAHHRLLPQAEQVLLLAHALHHPLRKQPNLQVGFELFYEWYLYLQSHWGLNCYKGGVQPPQMALAGSWEFSTMRGEEEKNFKVLR